MEAAARTPDAWRTHTDSVLRSASLRWLCIALATGCGRDTGHEDTSGLLDAKDLGGSWLEGSGDEGPGFDTGCVAAAWRSDHPPTYDYVNLVNPASVHSPGAVITVDEYVLSMDAEAAAGTISAFRAALPACTSSLAGGHEEPGHLVSLSSLPGAVVSKATRPTHWSGGAWFGPAVDRLGTSARSWPCLADNLRWQRSGGHSHRPEGCTRGGQAHRLTQSVNADIPFLTTAGPTRRVVLCSVGEVTEDQPLLEVRLRVAQLRPRGGTRSDP